LIADTFNHRIRRITPDGIITMVAGTGTRGFSGDGGPAVAAEISTPSGLAADAAGNLFIAGGSNYRTRKITPAGVITTVAGTGIAGLSGDGGPAEAAQFNFVWGIAVDAGGNLFVADTGI
jgi:sugar lactone lactonase YvrE